MDPTAVSSSAWLPELQRMLSVGEDLEDLLRRVTMLAAAAMPAGTSCVIAVEPPGRPLVVVGSDAAALAVGTTDWTHREGPHLAVTSSGRALYSPDIGMEGRWSAFAIEARARGIRCALTCPLQGPDEVMGVLSLYAPRPDAFDESLRLRAQGIADVVAGVIALVSRLADQLVLNEDLRQALESRAVIDQAIGVIMAENRCSRSDAFAILRSASQNRNAKLRDVAANLVQSVTGHEPMPGPFGHRR